MITAPETTQSLLEFGHAALGVLHDFDHLPAITDVHLSHPRYATVGVGEPYTLTAAYNLAVWAQAMGLPIRFTRNPLPELVFRVTLGEIPFRFVVGLHAGLVDQLAARTNTGLGQSHEFTARELIVGLGDHPDVDPGAR